MRKNDTGRRRASKNDNRIYFEPEPLFSLPVLLRRWAYSCTLSGKTTASLPANLVPAVSRYHQTVAAKGGAKALSESNRGQWANVDASD